MFCISLKLNNIGDAPDFGTLCNILYISWMSSLAVKGIYYCDVA